MTDKYYKKYLKYYFKYKNLKQKGGKPGFLNLDIPHDFNFGNKNTRALILPHAGSEYINDVLSYAFSDIKKYSKILLLTTNHHNSNNYSLDGISLTKNDPEFFKTEHSHLSVQAYIDRFNAKITTVSIGSYSEDLVQVLLKLIDDETLIIANTDLNHCGPNYNNTCSNVDETNRQIILDIINNKDEIDICGLSCIRVFNEIIKRLKLEYTEYTYSKSSFGDNHVGYSAILFNKLGIPNIQESLFLQSLAKEYTKTKERLKYELYLKEIEGLFVTILNNNELRGCIGSFTLRGDILQTIYYCTDQALHDSRFRSNPITTEEIPKLSFHITFLKKPFKSVDYKNEFKLGLHGLTAYFSDNRSATYLADVINDIFKGNLDNVIQSLKEKAGSNSELKYVELYECI